MASPKKKGVLVLGTVNLINVREPLKVENCFPPYEREIKLPSPQDNFNYEICETYFKQPLTPPQCKIIFA